MELRRFSLKVHGNMKNLSLVIVFILTCKLVTAQIQVKQVGKVHYTIIPSNEIVSRRNDSIAIAINNYVQQHAGKNFPDVLIYILDANPNSELTNFQEVLVYYQKHLGEFFNQYNNYYRYEKEHIGISLSLFKDHYKHGMEAIEYAVNNFKKLKKKEKRFSKKKKKDMLTDEDLKSFELFF